MMASVVGREGVVRPYRHLTHGKQTHIRIDRTAWEIYANDKEVPSAGVDRSSQSVVFLSLQKKRNDASHSLATR